MVERTFLGHFQIVAVLINIAGFQNNTLLQTSKRIVDP